MRNIVSFDIFDTLLTRRIIEPKDLFYLVGEVLKQSGMPIASPQAFRQIRIEAERNARDNTTHREVTLDEILVEVCILADLPPDATAKLKETELLLESEYLYPVPEGCRLLEEARKSADGIVFISDMYLPDCFIKSMLTKHDIWNTGDKLYVSGSRRAGKWNGTIFKLIEDDYTIGTKFIHHGDNQHSDVKMAKRANWEAKPIYCARPNRYEASYPKGNIEASRLMGLLRERRLNYEGRADSKHLALYTLGLEVLGPLLLTYGLAVSEWSKAESVDLLICPSRDGQIIKDVLDALTKKGVEYPTVTYFLTSRHALRIPEYHLNDHLIPDWLMEPSGNLNLRTIFRRLDLNIDDWVSVLAENSVERSTFDAPLNRHTRKLVPKLLKIDEIANKLNEQAKEKYDALALYLMQERILHCKRPAICDVGWNGSIQKSLNTLIRDIGNPATSLAGFYVCLKSSLSTHGLQGLSVIEPSNKLCQTHSFSEILELFMTATHGGAIRYSIQDDTAVCALAASSNLHLESLITIIREGVFDFIESAFEPTEPTMTQIDRDTLTSIAERNFYELLDQPGQTEVSIIGDSMISIDSTHDNFVTLCPDLSIASSFQYVYDRRGAAKLWYTGIRKKSGIFVWLTVRLTMKFFSAYHSTIRLLRRSRLLQI